MIDGYRLRSKVPAAILRALETCPETPKPGDPLFAQVQNVLVGSNPLAVQAALNQAAREGLTPYLLGTDLQGEARKVGRSLTQNLRQILQSGEPVVRPFCLAAGGETTVSIKGNGVGGRNQELALAAVDAIARSIARSVLSNGDSGLGVST